MVQQASLGIKKKVLFSLIPVLLILVLSEGVLRLIDYHSPIEDPFESFVYNTPLFQRHGQLFTTSPARVGRFHSTAFAAEKPAGTIRGFVVGGSTTHGAHLGDNAGLCYGGRLQVKLAERLQVPVQVINCGAPAYASYRLTHIVEEIVEYSPDFIVVMTGHNEFLEPVQYSELLEKKTAPWYTRLRVAVALLTLREMMRPELELTAIHDAVVGVQPFEKYIVRDEADFPIALEHYKRNLNRMSDMAEKKGIPLILCTTTSNVRDFAPFYSMNRNVSRKELADQLAVIKALMAEGNYAKALEGAQATLSRDSGVAVFHFLVAKAYEGLGRFDEAKVSYLRAKDTDGFPHRALSSFNDAVRKIAGDRNLTLLDSEAIFENASEHGLPGANLFIDNCHPTARGHEMLADALTEKIPALLSAP